MISFQHIRFDARDSWLGLKRRPLRSLLSSFGIGIGVAALVAMLSISEGAKQKALAKIVSLGTNTLRIENSTARLIAKDNSELNLSQGLTIADAETLKIWLAERAVIGSYARKDNVTITAGYHSVTATVLAVSDSWYNAEKLRLSWGRFHSKADEQLGRKLCVLGWEVKKKLRLNSNETIRVGNFPAKLVGELAPRGHLLTEGTGLASLDFDNVVILPLSIAPFVEEISGKIRLDGVVVSLKTDKEAIILKTAEHAENLLTTFHRGVDDFNIVTPLNLLREARDSQKLFSLIMGSIAGLSLLVGGIGVMNVMLANISEQTRDIGLRMAVGATRIRIISLYLWNSILLTTAGGLWGILGGVILAILVQEYAGWDTVFSYISLLIAPLSAIITGLLFGLHPAIRAASLEPAIALRDS